VNDGYVWRKPTGCAGLKTARSQFGHLFNE
jgi:hypothetical protein